MSKNRTQLSLGIVVSPRRAAKIAVLALAIGAFGAAGLCDALAQDDSIFGEDWPFPSGGSDIFGDDWPFPSGSGSSGGNINVGGSTGSDITMGGGSGIGIGGGSSDSGSGGGSGNSGSGGGEYNYP